MNPIVSVVIETVDLFRDPKNYIPYQRYLLRVGVGSSAYSIQRYKQKKQRWRKNRNFPATVGFSR